MAPSIFNMGGMGGGMGGGAAKLDGKQVQTLGRPTDSTACTHTHPHARAHAQHTHARAHTRTYTH